MSDAYEDLNRIAVFDDYGYLDHEATAGRLAAHDRDVKAEALQEFADQTRDEAIRVNNAALGAPQEEWVRARRQADRLEIAAEVARAAVLRGDGKP